MTRRYFNPADYADGPLPAGLVEGWPHSASYSAAIVTDATAPYGKVLRLTPTGAAGQDFPIFFQAWGTFLNPEVAALVRPNAGSTVQWSGVDVRSQIATESGYSVVLRTAGSGAPDVRIEERPGADNLAAASLAVAVGTWTWLKERVSGSSIQGKAWLGTDPDDMPGSWTLSASDSTYATAGYVGIHAQFGTVAASFDLGFFGMSDAGEDAPLAPPGTPVITAPTARQNAPSPVTVAWTGDAAATFEGEVQVDGGAWTSLFAPQSAMSYEWTAPADTRGHPVKVRVREVSPVGPWAESPTFYVSIWSDAGPAGTAITWTPVE